MTLSIFLIKILFPFVQIINRTQVITFSTLLDGITLNEFDLVILDLRLDPKSDSKRKNVGEISGAIILNDIRRRIKGIPVLMTTASNKVWSYEELMKLGADAYWMKEGIDNFCSAEDTVKNYHKLTILLESLTSERYKLLNYFEHSVEEIKANHKWFKSEITWANNEKQNVTINSIESIYEILEDGILMLRTFLHQSYLGQSYCLSQIDSYWLTGIINKLGGIVEEIHFPGKPGFDAAKVGGKWGKNNIAGRWEWGKMHRQDWLGFILLNFRNAASHNKLGKDLYKVEFVETFIKLLIYWLRMDIYNQFKSPIAINNTTWSEINRYTERFLKDNTIPNTP